MKYPEWKEFDFIYAGREREVFESLCRNLFRLRYGLSESLGYFKNHAGNETEVVEVDGEVVGFNAKYFDHTISATQIIHSIRKAIEDNPNQTKIIIYTNKEFGQSPKKAKGTTTTKQRIENEAKKQNLKLEWMFGQNILDAVIKSELLYNVFFNSDSNLRFLEDDVVKRNEHILRTISVESGKIHISRRAECEAVLNALQQRESVILSGCAGVGKSAIFKSLYSTLGESHKMVVLRGDYFDAKSADEVLSYLHSHTLTSLIEFYHPIQHKVLIVDSVENVPNLRKNIAFESLMYELSKEGWDFLFTIRDGHTDNFTRYLEERVGSLSYKVIDVKPLSGEALDRFCEDKHIDTDGIENLRGLLQIPFYLARFAELERDELADNVREFKAEIWKSKVCGGDYSLSQQTLRVQTIKEIVRYCERNQTLRVPQEVLNAEAMSHLIDDGVLIRVDDTLITFSHDIYRDWAYEEILRQDFSTLSLKEFLDRHKDSSAAMFAFGSFAREVSDGQDGRLSTIMADVFAGRYPEKWEEQIIAAALKSDHAGAFVESYKSQLLRDDCSWLARFIRILITCCQRVETYMEYKGRHYPIFVPEGEGWRSIIPLLQHTSDGWHLSNYKLLLKLFNICVRLPKPNGDAFDGIAKQLWRIYEMDEQGKINIHLDRDVEGDAHCLVCMYAWRLRERLVDVIERASLMTDYADHRLYIDLLEYMATTRDVICREVLARAIPDSYIKLLDWFWTTPEEEHRGMHEEDRAFGLNESNISLHYFPCSGLQTPIKELLESHPAGTIDFLVSLFNRCTDHFVQNNYWLDDGVFTAEFVAPNGESRQSLASDSLWSMYRDVSNLAMPDVLKSVLMALENYLLEQCDKGRYDVVLEYLKKILNESNSCMPIAVAASIAIAHPNEFWEISLSLFTSAGFLSLDNHRKSREMTSSNLYFQYNRHERLYRERRRANELPHRNMALEDLCLKLQIQHEESTDPVMIERMTRLYEILDQHHDMYNSWSEEMRDQAPFGFLLARIDARKMERRMVVLQDGTEALELLPQLNEGQKRHSQEVRNEAFERMKYPTLRTWAKMENEGSERTNVYPYHASPVSAFNLMQELYNEVGDGGDGGDEDGFLMGEPQLVPVVAGVLLSKFAEALDEEQRAVCVGHVERALAEPKFITDPLCDFEVCLSALPFLAERASRESKAEELAQLLLPYLCDTEREHTGARCCDTIREIIQSDDFYTANEGLIATLVEMITSTSEKSNMEDERLADALLCVLPPLTDGSRWTEVAKSCMESFAEYLIRLGKTRYPDSNLRLAHNVGHYIGSCDATVIPMLIDAIKGALGGGYASSQFLTGVLLQALTKGRCDVWRQVCDLLLDRVAEVERGNGFNQVTPLFMLTPEWVGINHTDGWYEFEQSDMDRLRCFVGKVPHRESILLHLLRVANGIGSKYVLQFLPLVVDVVHDEPELNYESELIHQMEIFMDCAIKTDGLKHPDTYASAVEVLNFMMRHNSTRAFDMLHHIKR